MMIPGSELCSACMLPTYLGIYLSSSTYSWCLQHAGLAPYHDLQDV